MGRGATVLRVIVRFGSLGNMAYLLGDVSASGRAPYFRARFLLDFNKNVAQMDVLHPEAPVAPRKTWK